MYWTCQLLTHMHIKYPHTSKKEHSIQSQSHTFLPDGLEELLLAGHELGEVELAAQLGALLEHRHAVAALRRTRREGQTRGARTHHADVLHQTVYRRGEGG